MRKTSLCSTLEEKTIKIKLMITIMWYMWLWLCDLCMSVVLRLYLMLSLSCKKIDKDNINITKIDWVTTYNYCYWNFDSLKLLCELLDVIINWRINDLREELSLLSKTQVRHIYFSSSRNTLKHKRVIANKCYAPLKLKFRVPLISPKPPPLHAS